jgi:hypothetical protein
MQFRWKCPFCNQNAIVTDENYSSDTHYFNEGNRQGELAIVTKVIVLKEQPLYQWRLRPQSSARPFPDYIPEAIRNDYAEACAIRHLSPKASATLSRRCLQGMIRDFWDIRKSRLIDEMSELQGRVDATTWQAIDSVRSLGNIGAHMEKDINLIVDVEPQEAKLLTGLIEILLEDWYIARHERDEHLKAIVAVAASKKQDGAPLDESESPPAVEAE